MARAGRGLLRIRGCALQTLFAPVHFLRLALAWPPQPLLLPLRLASVM